MPSAARPPGRSRPGPPVRARRPAPPRPLPLTAAWTGVVTALIACVVAVGAVAVVWLPASGGSGSASSAIRAGIITFLAGVHGGVTVDGVPTAFAPLGITVLVAALAWRAGTALAHAAEELDEHRPAALVRAVAALAGGFAVAAAVLAAGATLGTSSASVPGALVAGFVLAALAAGGAVARHTGFGLPRATLLPAPFAAAVRGATAVLAVHLGAGAVLVAGAVVVHHDRVATLSGEVGGGWSSVPVLLLGVLAAPNAVVAGSGYLSGAGFAVGAGSHVGLTSHTTGLVPAFPLLGALPQGPGAGWPVWVLAVLTPLVAGGCLAVIARRGADARRAWRTTGVAVALVAVAGALLAWQAGGAIGSGRLHAVGVSPWQYALLLAAGAGLVAAAVLGLASAVQAAGERERPGLRETISALTGVEQYDDEQYRREHGGREVDVDRPDDDSDDSDDNRVEARDGARPRDAGHGDVHGDVPSDGEDGSSADGEDDGKGTRRAG